MKILKQSFTVLSIAGMWKPRGWRGSKALLYYCYQSTVVICNHLFIISSALDLEFKDADLTELFDNLSLLLGIANARQKMSRIMLGRSEIKYITDTLAKSPFKPRNDTEEIISGKFDGIIRNIFICYLITLLGMWLYSVTRFSVVEPPHTLPFKGWFPYNYSNPKIYWLTAAFQFFAVNATNIVDLMSDILISAHFCQMCAQIHILKYRFNVMLDELETATRDTNGSDIKTTERVMMADWVEYHIDLINLTKYINKVFNTPIFVQYVVSSIILCSMAFLMSNTEIMSMNFAGYVGFLITFSFQIFQQCYCAHILTSESGEITEGIYNANWPDMSYNIRRSVTIIMCKCYKPILITSSFFIILSLEAFMKIVKLAYTIFNVLS